MKLKKEYNSVEVLKNGLDIVLLLEQDDYSSKDNFETTNSTNVLHESTDLQFSYDKRYAARLSSYDDIICEFSVYIAYVNFLALMSKIL